jgi:hypothetical protein
VIDDFDVVAVWIEHEGGVVARVVAGALARLAVAAVSAVASAWKRRTSSSSPAKATWTFWVGSPATTRKEPSDAPTENTVRSVVWRRIVSPAAAPIVE